MTFEVSACTTKISVIYSYPEIQILGDDLNNLSLHVTMLLFYQLIHSGVRTVIG